MTINPVIVMLADIRRAAGMSQRQVADAMGTRQSAVSEMETGVVTDVRLSTLHRYATAVGVELDVTVRPATPASAGEPKAQSKDLQTGPAVAECLPPTEASEWAAHRARREQRWHRESATGPVEPVVPEEPQP